MYRNLKRFLETSNLGLNSQSIIACQIHGHYSDEDTTRMYKQTHTPTAGQEENEGRGWGEVFDTQWKEFHWIVSPVNSRHMYDLIRSVILNQPSWISFFPFDYKKMVEINAK